MTREKVKELFRGPTEDNMQENGKEANNMELEHTLVIKEIANKVFGKMVKRLNGLIMTMIND